jgi:hypothetical protein
MVYLSVRTCLPRFGVADSCLWVVDFPFLETCSLRLEKAVFWGEGFFVGLIWLDFVDF